MIRHGDCIEIMAGLPAESIDAIVTDPPYGLGFMGKAWDALPPGREWADECYRVLKPGGHIVAFGGTRTYHRLAVAIEDAGFEIRDQLQWMYGSGFPKSLDVSKAIDKAAGAEREVVGVGTSWNRPDSKAGDTARMNISPGEYDLTAPATPAAQKWQGWGTALKPAFEPIILARKPLIGTVAENVTRYGTGGLNVDGCRVAIDPSDPNIINKPSRGGTATKFTGTAYNGGKPGGELGRGPTLQHPSGRWPANLILDPEAGAILDAQSGERASGGGNKNTTNRVNGSTLGDGLGAGNGVGIGGDTGGASRFFYTAKASRAERNAGLDGFEAKPVRPSGSEFGKQTMWNGENGDPEWRKKNPNNPAANVHPTVKPIDLMRYLVRLVTPPGGTVLDPFTGSGTTGIAANLEGFEFVGIEREAEYLAIAEARIKWWQQHEGDTAEILQRAGLAEKAEKAHAEAGQMDLLGEAA